MRWIGAAIAAIILLASSLAPSWAANLPALFGGPFQLVDHNGRSVTDRDFAGRFMLIYFGYTHCPDICPTDLSGMAAALDRIGPLTQRLQPLFITVDPERDTGPILRDFARALHPGLLGLTGSPEQIAAAAKAYRVHRRIFRVEGG